MRHATRLRLTGVLAGMAVVTTVIVVATLDKQRESKGSFLRVGYPSYWGTLEPPLQYTAYGGALIENQFEPLVRRGKGGLIEPLAAASWTINSDFTVFRFTIDTERRFSDGSYLKAEDFKAAWEYGLSLDPVSANNSLLDVLYKLAGFDDFRKTQRLAGVRVVDDKTLEIEFATPFRIALDSLSGERLAVFKKTPNGYLGTGPYVMREDKDHVLHMTKNPYYRAYPKRFDEIEVRIVDSSRGRELLASGAVELLPFAELGNQELCRVGSPGPVSCLTGLETSHRVIFVNALDGRFFAERKYRLAAQALVAQSVAEHATQFYGKDFFRLDLQTFLPLQPGRLDSGRVSELIHRGEPFIPSFIEATRKRPLFVVSGTTHPWLEEFLRSKGVGLSSRSGTVDTKSFFDMWYRTLEPDLMLAGLSVVNGDPDGIHHALGKEGAIGSPMIYRAAVGDLLEKGRQILGLSDMKAHYKAVSETILSEVPYVHIGFLHKLFAFRSDRVRVDQAMLDRNDYRFTAFQPR